MTVTNEDILAWMQQSQADFEGVTTAINSLDLEEARDAVGMLVALLKGMTATQEIHVRALEKTFAEAPDMSPDDKASVLIDSMMEMYLGIRGLNRLMKDMRKAG